MCSLVTTHNTGGGRARQGRHGDLREGRGEAAEHAARGLNNKGLISIHVRRTVSREGTPLRVRAWRRVQYCRLIPDIDKLPYTTALEKRKRRDNPMGPGWGRRELDLVTRCAARIHRVYTGYPLLTFTGLG